MTITENSGSEKYDGTEKTVTGYTVSIDNELYTEADFSFSGNDTVKGTDAGTYNMELKAEDFTNISTNFENVEFVIVDGTLTISKRTVTLTSADGTKVYDGTALTNSEVTVGGDKFAEGEGATYDVTGTITDVGSTANAFTYTLNEGTKADNYNISTTAGTLTVTPVTDKVTVTITEKSGSEKYDGTEKTVSGYEVTSISNTLYTEDDFSFSGNDTVKGTDAGTYNMELKPEDFTNNSTNFTNVEFVIVDGTLEIGKRAVTFTGESATRTYTGEAIELTGVTIGDDKLADGQSANVTYSAKGIEANTYPGTITAKGDVVIMAGETDVTPNYDITTTPGTLIITATDEAFEISLADDAHTYDGTAKANTKTAESKAKTGTTSFSYSFTEDGVYVSNLSGLTRTEAGEYTIYVKATNPNYKNAAKTTAKLTIGKRNITVTVADKTVEYNGNVQYGNATCQFSNVVAGQTATIGYTAASGKVAGEYTNGVYATDLKILEGTTDVTSNYNLVTATPGKLTITDRTSKYEITVTANSNTGNTYDGKVKSAAGFETLTFTVGGNTYTVEGLATSDPSSKDVTDVANAISGTPVVKDADDNDVTAQFTVKTADGRLEITQAKVTVKADNQDRTNRPGATDPELTAKITGLAEGDDESLISYTLARDPGEDPGEYRIYFATGETSQGNYLVEYIEGKLVIEDKTEPLYNIVNITGKGSITGLGWYRLSKTESGILTANDLDYYLSLFTSQDQKLDRTEYDASKVEPYNFKDLTITINNHDYVYADENTDIAALEAAGTDYYTVRLDDIYVSREIGGSKGWLFEATDQDTDPRNCFLRKYVVTLHPVYKTQILNNFLAVKGTDHEKSNYYRLNIGTITAPDALIFGKEYKTLSRDYPGVTVSGYDFSGIKLEFEERTYTYRKTEPAEDEVYDDYFTVEENTLINRRDYIHGNSPKSDWFGIAEGWKDQSKDQYAANGITTNIFKSWHLDHVATLHDGNMIKDEVVLTAKSGSKTYDGTELTNDGFEVSGLPAGYTVTATVEGSATDVGDAGVNTITAYTITENSTGADVTKYFVNVETKTGKLTINKRTVTLTSATDSRQYNGSPLTNSNVAVGGDGFAAGEGATYNVTGSQTLQGSSANTFTYTLNDGVKAGNYNITTSEGTLTVFSRDAKYTITVEAVSGTAKYDGTDHTVSGLIATTFTVDNHDYTVEGLSASVTGKDAATYPVNVIGTPVVRDSEGNDVTAQFAVGTKNGELVISKRTVTMTSGSGEKVYDRTALTNSNVAETGDGFITGEGATYTVTGSQKDIGESANTFSYTLNEGTKAENYEITQAEGNLKVTPYTGEVIVTITEAGNEAMYDGEEYAAAGYSVAISDPLYKTADFTFSGTAEVKGTDAGSYPMELKPEDFRNINDNFTNVRFVIVDGSLEISKRAVTMTSADAEKVYDKIALTNGTVTETGDGFAEGEGAAYDVTGTQTDAGESANAFTYTLNEGTKADNYDITTVEGTLKVTSYTTPVTVTITEHSGEAKYDGAAHDAEGYDVEISDPLYTTDDFSFSGDATVSGTDAGSYPMELTGADFANINDNFTDVTFEIVDGSLEISKREVTLTSADDEKIYDRTELTNGTVTVGGDGFADGEGAAYDVTGTQTEVGESANAFTYTLNEGTKADNYDITTAEGTLKVTPYTEAITVTITEPSDTLVYDAETHSLTGYEVSISDPLYTTDDFRFNGIAEVSGRNTGTYRMGLTAANFENTNANFADVTFEIVSGALVIRPKTATITANDKTMTYGDSEPALTATVDGMAGNDYAAFTMSREAGRNIGTYAINASVQANPNYIFTVIPGSLTVNPKPVTVTADSKVKTYGAADPELTAAVSGLVSGESADLISYTLGRDAGEDAGGYPIHAAGEAAQGNYTVAYEDAVLTIVPADTVIVRIAANNGTFMYDGTEKDLSGYTVTEISNELYTEEDFTFTGSSELKGTNAGTYRTAMTADDFANANGNFSDVIFEVTNGTLEITKRTVTITSGDATKAYDGTALTNTEVTMEGDGFAEGEEPAITVTGRQTREGTSENTFTYTLPADASEANYDITVNFGTLTVTNGSATHRLIIHYVDENGEEIEKPFERSYADGETYHVTVPRLTGYQPETDRITGTIDGKDVEVTVRYTKLTYTLTIDLTSITTGESAGDPITMQLTNGENYDVTIPATDGFTPMVEKVTGTMPANDRTITVFMIPDGENADELRRNYNSMIIEDYGTPLGVFNSVLGSGELAE